ncbi:MAG: HAMP domain-containing protein [bacterium]|nr:HAMP domain-containing protein [bacterium]
MKRGLRLPIRMKILITLLILVTGVVSAITFAMANLFHRDKALYINDLTSIVAVSVAEECQTILDGYRERLRVYSRLMTTDSLANSKKESLLTGYFEDFPELIAVALQRDGHETSAVYNVGELEAAGLTKERLQEHLRANPVPPESLDDSALYLRNSTISDSLPMFTMALPARQDPDEPFAFITAVIRLDELMHLSSRNSAYSVILADAEDVLLAHPDRARVTGRARANLRPDVTADVHGGRSEGITLEYVSNQGYEVIGGFAGIDIGRVTAGAEIPKSVAFLTARTLLSRLLFVALMLLIAATVAGLFYAHRITRPVERLSHATREIGKGDFDVEIKVTSRDEMGALANSFNQMASELKHRDEKLNQAQEQLVQSEKMAAFGQLGAGIAHEVKNPLAGILGCAQLALRKARDTPLHDNLKLIEKETKRCKTIIENLLKFARQEKASLEPMQANTPVEDACAIVNHQLELHKVKLEKDLFAPLPLIYGNGNQLQQVLMNLMINAQQAMDGEPGNIRVSTRPVGAEAIEICVADDGPGMSDEVRAKVFEPFFTTKPGGKGTGLGLSVSFGIITDHRGQIQVESEAGQGTTFRIQIPVVQASANRETGESDAATA